PPAAPDRPSGTPQRDPPPAIGTRRPTPSLPPGATAGTVSAVAHADPLEHGRRVALRAHAVERLHDRPVRPDHERAALDAHVLAAVHGLLDPDPVRLGNGVVRVRQQHEAEPVLVAEADVARDRVGAHADHAGTAGVILGHQVAELARLDGA